jgi:hypothetical protein
MRPLRISRSPSTDLGQAFTYLLHPDSYPQSYESIDEEAKGPKLLRRRASVWYV